MRVLALSTWWPEPADNGSRMRISQLLRALAGRHEVHLIAFTQGPAEQAQRAELSKLCASLQPIERHGRPIRMVDRMTSLVVPEPASVRATWSTALVKSIAAAVAEAPPDVVIAFEVDMVPYARSVPNVPRIIEDLEPSNILNHFRAYPDARTRLRFLLTAFQYRRYLATVLKEFAGITVVSAHEAALVRMLAGQHPLEVASIPNGADIAGCAGYSYDPEPNTLIYPGALSYDANLDAMQYFLGAVLPLIRQANPQVNLRITGRSTPEQRAALPTLEGVELTGYVEDVRALIARSAVEVVPLRQGGGTRLKILEAMAVGTPVVSTSKGAEGLDLRDGEDLLIADGHAAFAAATTRLLSQPDLRARLGAAGRRAVCERYDWRVIGARFEQLVSAIVGGKSYVRGAA